MVNLRRLFTKHRALLGFAFIVLIGAWANYKSYQNAGHLSDESVTREYQTCLSANDGRRALKDVISIATAQGVTVDLSLLPSYPDLDPPTKSFIDELNRVLNSSSASDSSAARLQAFSTTKLELRDCEKILAAAK